MNSNSFIPVRVQKKIFFRVQDRQNDRVLSSLQPWCMPGLRTRSIFNRVQEIFASSSSKNFIYRVQVRVRQK